MEHLDKLCIKYKILPSIIKDSRLEKDIFDKCYPEADIFRDKLTKFDKEDIINLKFQSIKIMSYLIVGASSGLGRELAYVFASKGHNIIILQET